jgi:hypothetical protein
VKAKLSESNVLSHKSATGYAGHSAAEVNYEETDFSRDQSVLDECIADLPLVDG